MEKGVKQQLKETIGYGSSVGIKYVHKKINDKDEKSIKEVNNFDIFLMHIFIPWIEREKALLIKTDNFSNQIKSISLKKDKEQEFLNWCKENKKFETEILWTIPYYCKDGILSDKAKLLLIESSLKSEYNTDVNLRACIEVLP